MNNIEAMKLALEALSSDRVHLQLEAKVALRQAIEQAEQAQPEGGPPGSGGWQFYAEEMERQRDYYRQRVQTIRDHKNGDCWYWQGNGEDHPESMVNSLPVVIRADQLRALMTGHAVQGGPVAWRFRWGTAHGWSNWRTSKQDLAIFKSEGFEIELAYTTPPPRQHEESK